MRTIRKAGLCFAVLLAVAPFVARGQDGSVLTGSSSLTFSGGTLQLGANTGILAQSVGGGGPDGGSFALLGTLELGSGNSAGGNLYVGAGGLTTAQLAEIELDGAYINIGGYVVPPAGSGANSGTQVSVVPEPGVSVLLALGGAGLAALRRWRLRIRK